jgi:hypothetical protein
MKSDFQTHPRFAIGRTTPLRVRRLPHKVPREAGTVHPLFIKYWSIESCWRTEPTSEHTCSRHSTTWHTIVVTSNSLFKLALRFSFRKDPTPSLIDLSAIPVAKQNTTNWTSLFTSWRIPKSRANWWDSNNLSTIDAHISASVLPLCIETLSMLPSPSSRDSTSRAMIAQLAFGLIFIFRMKVFLISGLTSTWILKRGDLAPGSWPVHVIELLSSTTLLFRRNFGPTWTSSEIV